MCAICGIVRFDHQPVEQAVVQNMRDVMTNRGPEYGGLYHDQFVGLGHRRLKIIDLSVNGNQPMTNEAGDVWVVFNGEIYNFQELRPVLAAKGHQFRSNSDTEVIVHGYEEWGEGIFSKLDGMFAVGIWDARKERLVLGRDRFGKKPLFYRVNGAQVDFASDIKAFWVADNSGLSLSHEAIDCYLFHMAVPQQHAIFKEVRKLQPAHYAVFDANGHRTARYWQLDYTKKVERSEAETIELIDTQLKAAIKKRLISDVPLGAFLSGGIDSSLVVALMSGMTGGRCKTFSIGFQEKDYSEIEYSRQVAKRYDTDHQEIVLKADVLDILPSLVWEYGEPFADSSAIPTYYVSQAARQFVTVALSGDGGDEMFGGYDIARAAFYSSYYEQFCPTWLKDQIESAVFSRPNWGKTNSRLHKFKTLLVHASRDPKTRHSYSMAFSQTQKEPIYTAAFKNSINGHTARHIYDEYWPQLMSLNLIDRHLVSTIQNRLPDDYLVKVDVASMKCALELRCPFLDTQLSELSGTIDPRLKVRHGEQKHLLKKLAERYLPYDLIYRKKRGFELPLAHWLRADFSKLVADLLGEGTLVRNGLLEKQGVMALLAEHVSGQANHTHRIWALFWLELWYRMFVDRTLKPTDSLH